MEPGPRLLAAIKAAMPLLQTQKDALLGETAAVPAVYRYPLTRAEQLRRQADELDARDKVITELREALREHDHVESVRRANGITP